MNQKLYAFWKYDSFPYVLGGEVIRMEEDGYVSVDGYGNMKFKPIKLLPYNQGMKIHAQISEISREYDFETKKIWNSLKEKVDNLLL